LISSGEYEDAEEYIRQYEEFAGTDLQILSYKSDIQANKKIKGGLN